MGGTSFAVEGGISAFSVHSDLYRGPCAPAHQEGPEGQHGHQTAAWWPRQALRRLTSPSGDQKGRSSPE